MKIESIFEILKGCLYAVKFEHEVSDEFSKAFDQWTDVEYLFKFFEENFNDLNKEFYEEINIEKAIERTLEETKNLEETLLHIAETGINNRYNTLQTLFKPLNNLEYQIAEHQKSKAYGSAYKSWLRVYAIRIEANTFVVSGSAIKLTRTMQEREHTLNELSKLNATKAYLIEQGLFDKNDFEYLELS